MEQVSEHIYHIKTNLPNISLNICIPPSVVPYSKYVLASQLHSV